MGIFQSIRKQDLLKAEVENALGNTDAALQNLNVVAKRAYGVDNYYTARTQDAIDNAIISEILKEFVAAYMPQTSCGGMWDLLSQTQLPGDPLFHPR